MCEKVLQAVHEGGDRSCAKEYVEKRLFVPSRWRLAIRVLALGVENGSDKEDFGEGTCLGSERGEI